MVNCLLSCLSVPISLKRTSTAAAATCLRSVGWMELVGGCMNPSPVLDYWAKPAWWSPETLLCARWQLGERVLGQASAELALVLWPPPLFLQARHRHFWPAHFSLVHLRRPSCFFPGSWFKPVLLFISPRRIVLKGEIRSGKQRQADEIWQRR